MIRIAILLIISLCCLGVSDAQAQKHPIDIKLEDCLEENYSTSGMMDCTSEALIAWGEELDKNYKQIQSILSDEGKTAMKDSQQKWEEFKTKEFALIDAMYMTVTKKTGGGTMYKLIGVNQKLQVIKNRALEIKGHYNYITSQGR
ncbi:MAG: DUF1311 domain-containing protein [Saprospiraceae bacterium]|nr:DUF1311 domain-containing protein [Saprospiraceae bacterium]